MDALLHHLPGKDGTRPSVSLQLIAHYPPLACFGAGLASRINSKPSWRVVVRHKLKGARIDRTRRRPLAPLREDHNALCQVILLLKYEEVICLGDWFAARLAEVIADEA
ncbi:MAG: hypothetical protein WB630_05885 [Candidatus Acidiferrales bacterium]